MGKMIPCEYIGEYKIELRKQGGPYFDKNGKQLLDLNLNKGDTLLMPEEEVKGYTILRDMRHEKEPVNLGIGRVILPSDTNKSDEELYALGYQFHQGRPDFRVLPEVPDFSSKKKKDGVE